jgi:UDP-N-acetylmuramyl pentapeptide phosphotransferase/UDP-N-acetylglucosamine-1-phosphate transferase
MVEIFLLFSLVISFLLTVLVLPLWIRKTKRIGFLWEDMNKYKRPKNVSASGGIVAVIAFVLGVLYYIVLV